MVIFGLGKDLLFKSVVERCDIVTNKQSLNFKVQFFVKSSIVFTGYKLAGPGFELAATVLCYAHFLTS